MLQEGKRHDLTGGGLLNDVKSLICYIAVRLLNFSGSSVSCHLKISKSAESSRISGFQKNDNFQKFIDKYICNYSAAARPKVWYFSKHLNPSMELLKPSMASKIPETPYLCHSANIKLNSYARFL